MSASAVCRARVGWSDTDAGGHHHHASITRFVEEAEAQLYRTVGDPDLMALVPRVEYHAEFVGRLYYQDEVEVTLRVAKIGRTSLTYEFEVRRVDDGSVAARGGYVVVHIDEDTRRSAPWPDDLRAALSGG
jgi:acyl-CoA thioester hydrolase